MQIIHFIFKRDYIKKIVFLCCCHYENDIHLDACEKVVKYVVGEKESWCFCGSHTTLSGQFRLRSKSLRVKVELCETIYAYEKLREILAHKS